MRSFFSSFELLPIPSRESFGALCFTGLDPLTCLSLFVLSGGLTDLGNGDTLGDEDDFLGSGEAFVVLIGVPNNS